MKAVVFAGGESEFNFGTCGQIRNHLPKALERCFIFPPCSLCQEAKMLPFFLYISPPAWRCLFFIRCSLYWPVQDRSLWFSKLYSWENISIEGSVTCLRWVNKLLTGEKLEFTSEWSDFQRSFYCFLDLINLEVSVGGWQEVYWLMLVEYRNSIPIWW